MLRTFSLWGAGLLLALVSTNVSSFSTQKVGLVSTSTSHRGSHLRVSQGLKLLHQQPTALWGTLDDPSKDQDEQLASESSIEPSLAAPESSPLSKSKSNKTQIKNNPINFKWKRALATVCLAATAAALAAPGPAAAAAEWATNSAATLSSSAATLSSQTAIKWSALVETGFYQAFSLVFVSEIGDKTFFIAGLLAMKTSRFISFIGSIAALAAMTVVSVVIGQVFHVVPSGFADGVPLDDYAAVVAFAFFGLKTLKEAFDLEEGESTMDEELADAQEAVSGSRTISEVTAWGQIASIFALVFAAEFGDRSFLSTIALSAAQNPVSVAGGAIAAHAVATGIAVSGGAYVSKYISEKVIGIIGGTLFLVFAVTTALGVF